MAPAEAGSPSSQIGPPQATLVRGLGAVRLLAVDATDGVEWQISLDGQGLGGTWVTISWREAGGGGVSRILLTALSEEDGRASVSSLPEEAYGRDVFAWTGRLPDGITALRLATLSRMEPFPLDSVTIRHRSRSALLASAFIRQPDLTARALYWRCLRLKVRARGLLSRALSQRSETGYATWVKHFDTLTPSDRTRIRSEVAAWPDPPTISVVMPVYNPGLRVLEAAMQSVRRQLYPHWELCICDDASTDPAVPKLLDRYAALDPRIRFVRRAVNGHIARASNDALALAQGEFCAFLDHDDELSETALYEVARAVQADPDLVLIYSDEDKIDGRGRRFDPHFKSDYNRELLYGQNYMNHLSVVRTGSVHELGGLRPGFEGSQDHDLLLRLTRDLPPERIRHIPKILYHWRAADGSGTFSDRALVRAEAARLQALAQIAAPMGAQAERGPRGFNRLVRSLPEQAPLVSVVIPTRDRAELLEVAVKGLFEKTDYAPLEIVVVDNDSQEERTRALFARYEGDSRFRVVPVPGAFNFSDLSNRGAAAARGSILLFLNNDIEVIELGWLRELVSIALDESVGAVGAKLLYPDGTLQHGGIVLGIGGVAGHSHHGLPGDEPGYFARMALSQEVSAVTGACLAMRSAVFLQVGGFDAEALKVAFNDVDLCLKIRAAGYRIVWTPHARLIHHESKSRGAEDTPEKRHRFDAESRVMRERWGPILRADPYYNPNLSRVSAHFRL